MLEEEAMYVQKKMTTLDVYKYRSLCMCTALFQIRARTYALYARLFNMVWLQSLGSYCNITNPRMHLLFLQWVAQQPCKPPNPNSETKQAR